LDGMGISPPTDFTDTIMFRACATCGEPNIVRGDHHVRTVCDANLAPNLAVPTFDRRQSPA
jgi:hypothetical protein